MSGLGVGASRKSSCVSAKGSMMYATVRSLKSPVLCESVTEVCRDSLGTFECFSGRVTAIAVKGDGACGGVSESEQALYATNTLRKFGKRRCDRVETNLFVLLASNTDVALPDKHRQPKRPS